MSRDMRKPRRAMVLIIVSLIGSSLFGFSAAGRQEGLTRDEVYFSLARRINAQSESPVSAIVQTLGEVIEVTEISAGADGKTTVTVKEVAPSNARATNKTIRLIFAPSAEARKWTWESFEDNRKFYPVERLFPYAKDRLGKLRQAAEAGWNKYLESMTKEGEAATKVLETAKAILRQDPPPLSPVAQARAALDEARKGIDVDAIVNAHRELQIAIEPVTQLGELYPDLKANDAFLRLQEELKAARETNKAAKKAYLGALFVYNDDIRRLPFALVAYGLEFTRIEAKVESE